MSLPNCCFQQPPTMATIQLMFFILKSKHDNERKLPKQKHVNDLSICPNHDWVLSSISSCELRPAYFVMVYLGSNPCFFIEATKSSRRTGQALFAS